MVRASYSVQLLSCYSKCLFTSGSLAPLYPLHSNERLYDVIRHTLMHCVYTQPDIKLPICTLGDVYMFAMPMYIAYVCTEL